MISIRPSAQWPEPRFTSTPSTPCSNRAFLSETTFLEDILLVLLAGAAAWLIFVFVSRPILQVFCGLAGNAFGLLLTFAAYDRWNTYVAVIAPLLAFNVSGGSALVYELVVERLENFARAAFSSATSPRMSSASCSITSKACSMSSAEPGAK